MTKIWCLIAVVSLSGSFADVRAESSQELAQEEAGDDFEDDDFGDDEFQHKEVAPTASSNASLVGFSRSNAAFWAERFDDQPLAKLRQSLDVDFRLKADTFRLVVQLHGEYDAAMLVERDRFDAPTLEAYETKFNTREAFASFQFGDFQVALGRLIDVWGTADLLTILDVTNPRDLREPGTTDLDDIRLPVLGTRISWSRERHGVEVLVVHEHDVGYRPAPLSDYSPLQAIIAADPTISTFLAGKTLRYRMDRERFNIENQSYLVRWNWNGPSIDLSLMGGSLLDRQGVFALDSEIDLSADDLNIDLLSPRYGLIGHSGAWVLGQWVLMWELAYEQDRVFNVSPDPPFPTESGSLLSALLGARYTGVTDLILSVEVRRSFLLNELSGLLFDVEALNIALLASYTTLSERLELSAAFLMSGYQAQYGWMLRGEAGWRVVDGLRVGLGYITYQPGDDIGLFYGLDTHDRLFMGLRWDFQVL